MSQVEGLMRLMEGEHVGPFNLGNPGEFTMLELAKVDYLNIDSRCCEKQATFNGIQLMV